MKVLKRMTQTVLAGGVALLSGLVLANGTISQMSGTLSVRKGDGTVRNLWLKCEHCGDTLRKLTTRSDDEIAAELAGQ